MQRIPIGVSDYKTIIEGNYYYVDKTLLIKEIVEAAGTVALIPRPRRFGKTLNLSMLKYFFEQTKKNNAYLFKDKLIWQEKEYHALQGKHPVIFISLKDVKHSTWQKTYKHLITLISQEFDRLFADLLPTMTHQQQHVYKAIVQMRADEVEFGNSLKFLTELLHNHYQQKVIVLFDEYDTPIHAAHFHGFYQEIIEFMRSLLCSLFKDNVYLERGVITGILMIAKEGLFSGLNNLDVASITGYFLLDKFGFTPDEVKSIVQTYKSPSTLDQLQKWYDGYQFGNVAHLYNPWSILKHVRDRGPLQPYWVNTSDNLLLMFLLARASGEVKQDFEQLLQEQPVVKNIDESIIFSELEERESALWTLLMYSGYLTYKNYSIDEEGQIQCILTIPNKEIKSLYRNLIRNVFAKLVISKQIQKFLDAVITGNVEAFSDYLQGFLLKNFSVFDISPHEPEISYHMFVLGLLVLLDEKYSIKSNRESGYGRYDIILVPKSGQTACIIEFKKVHSKETLSTAAQRALAQINEKKYAQELYDSGITDIIAYGIAFQGKRVLIKMQNLQPKYNVNV
jgi:hypothetical protein